MLEDIVEEFMKMRQEGTVEYRYKFGDLRIRMESVMSHLRKTIYFVDALVD